MKRNSFELEVLIRESDTMTRIYIRSTHPQSWSLPLLTRGPLVFFFSGFFLSEFLLSGKFLRLWTERLHL